VYSRLSTGVGSPSGALRQPSAAAAAAACPSARPLPSTFVDAVPVPPQFLLPPPAGPQPDPCAGLYALLPFRLPARDR
jgi:hypothetical protein